MNLFKTKLYKVTKPSVLKSTYDVTATIDSALNKIGFLGYTRNAKNEIVPFVTTMRFCILLFGFISTSAICTILKRKTVYDTKLNQGVHHYMEILCSTVAIGFVVCTMIENYRCNMIPHIEEYYQNLSAVDDILRIPMTSLYTKEIKKYNSQFVVAIAAYVFKMALDLSITLFVLSQWYTIFFIDYIMSTCLVFVSQLNVMIRLMILSKRFRIFGCQLITALQKPWKDNKEDYIDGIVKYKLCYQLFCKQLFIVNKVYGWQILIAILHLVLFVMRAVYGFVALLAHKMFYKVFWYSILLVGQVAIAVGVVYKMAQHLEIVVKVRGQILSELEELLLQLEDNLMDQSIDKEVYRQVITLLEQIRRQPTSLRVCNLFNLDYRMLRSVLSLVVTYTIVLAQLNIGILKVNV